MRKSSHESLLNSWLLTKITKEVSMFKTKNSRRVVANLLWVLVSFTSLWVATDDAAAAAKFVLGLYLVGGAFALSMISIYYWISKVEE